MNLPFPARRIIAAIFTIAAIHSTAVAETVWLSSLDIGKTEQGWGKPQADKSVAENPLSIGGQKFEHGLGTHGASALYVDLKGGAEKFSASVGVDDEVGAQRGNVEFRVLGDGKILWKSGAMKGGEPAKKVGVDLHGVKTLLLLVKNVGEGNQFNHADWADAQIEFTGDRPETAKRPHEAAVILTPKSSPKPRINSAKVFGVRPGSPFLYTIAATGDRPMHFAADHLPQGLMLDSKTGRITGVLKDQGEHVVTLHAENSLGSATRELKIVCGPTIGLTPAMGWNSWNCFASAVTAEKVKAAADALVASGLIDHGWTYINIDDFWQVHRNSKDPTLQGPQRDEHGRILPNPRFPDMKGLAEYVHDKGLRIGLYSSPGPWTCGGCVGSFDHELPDAQQYAEWGFDYLKYDWCSYMQELELHRGDSSVDVSKIKSNNASHPTDREILMRPYAIMQHALEKQPRDIIYSLCQYGMGDVWEWGALVNGNSWRTTGDITDTWGSLSNIGFSQNGHEKYAQPGHFNDPDMLIVGKVGWGPKLHPTRLSPNEQYTHISLWCLLTAPLLIGCDMTQLDDFTLNLLTNDEVIEVNQDPLCKQATRVSKDDDLEVWAKDMEDGSKAVGLFNRGESDATVAAKWSELGLTGKHSVRDLWRQQDLGMFDNQFKANIPPHGVVLVRISKAK